MKVMRALWRKLCPPKKTYPNISTDDIVGVQPMTKIDPEVASWFHWCSEEEAEEILRKVDEGRNESDKGGSSRNSG